jgi:hypothetical protein
MTKKYETQLTEAEALAAKLTTWFYEEGVDVDLGIAALGIAYAVGCATLKKDLSTAIKLVSHFYTYHGQDNATH